MWRGWAQHVFDIKCRSGNSLKSNRVQSWTKIDELVEANLVAESDQMM